MVRNKKEIQKVGLKHMVELYDLAKCKFPEETSKNHIKLLVNYSTKYNIPIPKEIKRSFCKKCNSLLIPGKSCRVRIKSGKAPLRVITCSCGQIKRIGFKKE